MFLDLQKINAFVVSSDNLYKIKGCHTEEVLGCKTINSTRYYHESKETITSSNTPLGVILDRFVNYRTMGVE
jgi:hypothetical protein